MGICYHNRGCLKAKLARCDPKTLESAKNDVQRGIDILSELIDERSSRQSQQVDREIEQQIKDNYILSCRYYTRGVMGHNYIMGRNASLTKQPKSLSQEEVGIINEATADFQDSILIMNGSHDELNDSFPDNGGQFEVHSYSDFVVYQQLLTLELQCVLFRHNSRERKRKEMHLDEKEPDFNRGDLDVFYSRERIERLISRVERNIKALQHDQNVLKVQRYGMKPFKVEHLR